MTSKTLECSNKQARDSVLEAALLGVSSSTSAEVQRHLETCASCAREWKEFSSTMALLDEWQIPEPSPYFDTRLRARVREEAGAPVSFWQRFLAPLMQGRMLYGWRAATAGTLGIVLVVGGIVIDKIMTPPPKEDACSVVDMQSLGRNAEVLQGLNALDDSTSENP